MAQFGEGQDEWCSRLSIRTHTLEYSGFVTSLVLRSLHSIFRRDVSIQRTTDCCIVNELYRMVFKVIANAVNLVTYTLSCVHEHMASRSWIHRRSCVDVTSKNSSLGFLLQQEMGKLLNERTENKLSTIFWLVSASRKRWRLPDEELAGRFAGARFPCQTEGHGASLRI